MTDSNGTGSNSPPAGTTLATGATGTPPPDQTPSPASEFKPDPGKTEVENATAKAAWDAEQAAKAKPPEETPEQKAAKEAAAKNAVSKDNPFKPEELKLPDGVKIDETTSKSFVDLVNKFGIGRDAAAELVNLQVAAMKAASEKGDSAWNDMQTEWQNNIKADPDFAGDKFTTAQAGIGQLLTKYGDAATRAAFDLTGAGNNPAIFKMLSKIAQDLTEPGPRPVPSLTSVPKDHASILFPNQGKAA